MKKAELTKLLNQIIDDRGMMIRNFTNADHGKYLITGPQEKVEIFLYTKLLV